MRPIFLALTILLSCPKAMPQTATISEDSSIHESEEVDRMPRFPGGDRGFSRFFDENFRLPDLTDSMRNIKKLTPRFVVETDGTITNLEFPEATVLDPAVRRLFEKMPKWEPGKHHGKFVRVRHTLSINISLY